MVIKNSIILEPITYKGYHSIRSIIATDEYMTGLLKVEFIEFDKK